MIRAALGAIVVTYVMLSAALIYYLSGEVDWLTDRLNKANEQLSARQVVRPSDRECAAWLFSTDLAGAKARICKRP